MFFLAAYIPAQNTILPIVTGAFPGGSSLALPMVAFKDFLLASALVGLLPSGRRVHVTAADVFGLLFLAFLLVNLLASPADLGSSLRGMRAYAVPVSIYFYGRLASTTGLDVRGLIRFVLLIGGLAVLFGLLEALLSSWGLSPMGQLWERYFEFAYGHGRPTGSGYAPGFLSLRGVPGPFGNRLIMSTYLRFVLCLLIFYVANWRAVATSRDFLLGGLFVIGSVLTLSRYGIAALFLIIAVLMLRGRPLSALQKVGVMLAASIALAFSSSILIEVVRRTAEVGDESTYVHMQSMQELAGQSSSLLGHGLGTGAHSPVSRSVEVGSAGEGLLRQGMPEIGLAGVMLFVLFVMAVIWGLATRKRFTNGGHRPKWPYVWIAAPLLFELLRIPLDVSIRSFLGTGLAWFFAGYFLNGDDHVAGRAVRWPADVMRRQVDAPLQTLNPSHGTSN